MNGFTPAAPYHLVSGAAVNWYLLALAIDRVLPFEFLFVQNGVESRLTTKIAMESFGIACWHSALGSAKKDGPKARRQLLR